MYQTTTNQQAIKKNFIDFRKSKTKKKTKINASQIISNFPNALVSFMFSSNIDQFLSKMVSFELHLLNGTAGAETHNTKVSDNRVVGVDIETFAKFFPGDTQKHTTHKCQKAKSNHETEY